MKRFVAMEKNESKSMLATLDTILDLWKFVQFLIILL